MHKVVKFISPVIIIAGLYFIFKTKEIKQPSGILAPDPPSQSELNEITVWDKDNYIYYGKANFSAKIKVLSIKSYGSDDMSDICPYDIAAGWKKMSDQSVVDRMEIKQQHRWYVWSTRNMPIPRKDIEINSTNIHVIPANDNIEDKLDDIIRGNIITLKGKLVDVKSKTETYLQWKSSLSRNDTGNGACEILWVEDIEIIQ